MPDENGPSTEHWIPEPEMNDTDPNHFTVEDFEDTENVTKTAGDTEGTTESS